MKTYFDKTGVLHSPSKLFSLCLVLSYLIGEVLQTYINLIQIFNLIGLLLLIVSLLLFLLSLRMFLLYKENLALDIPTEKIIKTGIYSYTRNPIYISFIGFQLGMFLLFENIMYFLSSILLFFRFHFKIVLMEEKYLEDKFGEMYKGYKENVTRWISFN